jgi:hypothetical protein
VLILISHSFRKKPRIYTISFMTKLCLVLLIDIKIFDVTRFIRLVSVEFHEVFHYIKYSDVVKRENVRVSSP